MQKTSFLHSIAIANIRFRYLKIPQRITVGVVALVLLLGRIRSNSGDLRDR
jgi:hypothetical protein